MFGQQIDRVVILKKAQSISKTRFLSVFVALEITKKLLIVHIYSGFIDNFFYFYTNL